MRKILVGVALALVALVVGGIVGYAPAASFTGVYSATPNDYYAVSDTVASPTKVDTLAVVYSDTIVPDGEYNYAVTVVTPSDANTAGLWVMLSPSSGNSNTEWMLLRDEIGIWTWEVQVDTVFVRGAGAADTTGTTRYQVWFLQDNF